MSPSRLRITDAATCAGQATVPLWISYTPLFALDALANAGYKPDRITDGIVANVVAQQSSTGHWVVPHGAIARPPIEDGDIARTALGIGALKNYGAPGRAADLNARIARARDWLGIVVCAQPRAEVPAVFRKRFSLRARPVDLADGDRMGGVRVDARHR